MQLNKYHARRGEHAAAAVVEFVAVQMQVCTDKFMQAVGWSCKQEKVDVMEMGCVLLMQCCVM